MGELTKTRALSSQECVSPLSACPFCGGAAARHDIEAREDVDNAGASYIECSKCGATTQLHFDRKENLVDSWNRRPPGNDYYLVPREIVDRFPEINPVNYDHDDACALNAWGVEVVTSAAPNMATASQGGALTSQLDQARFEKAFEAYSEAENTLKGIEAAIQAYGGHAPTRDQIEKLIRGHCSVRVQGEDHPVRDGVESAADAIIELIRKVVP